MRAPQVTKIRALGREHAITRCAHNFGFVLAYLLSPLRASLPNRGGTDGYQAGSTNPGKLPARVRGGAYSIPIGCNAVEPILHQFVPVFN